MKCSRTRRRFSRPRRVIPPGRTYARKVRKVSARRWRFRRRMGPAALTSAAAGGAGGEALLVRSGRACSDFSAVWLLALASATG